jgi:hypothetical protein
MQNSGKTSYCLDQDMELQGNDKDWVKNRRVRFAELIVDVVDPCNSTAHKKKLDKDGKCTKDYTEIDKWLNGKYLRKFIGN